MNDMLIVAPHRLLSLLKSLAGLPMMANRIHVGNRDNVLLMPADDFSDCSRFYGLRFNKAIVHDKTDYEVKQVIRSRCRGPNAEVIVTVDIDTMLLVVQGILERTRRNNGEITN